MKSLVAGLTMTAVSLWGMSLSPKSSVDIRSILRRNGLSGPLPKPADELKKQLDGGNTVLIIDVRQAANFEKETIPGAINIPLAELEGHLKKVSKDAFIVFT